jgi:hypothetical protein
MIDIFYGKRFACGGLIINHDYFGRIFAKN